MDADIRRNHLDIRTNTCKHAGVQVSKRVFFTLTSLLPCWRRKILVCMMVTCYYQDQNAWSEGFLIQIFRSPWYNKVIFQVCLTVKVTHFDIGSKKRRHAHVMLNSNLLQILCLFVCSFAKNGMSSGVLTPELTFRILFLSGLTFSRDKV